MDFRGYLLKITAAAVLAALIRRLAPKGNSGRAARFGAGLLVVYTVLSPVAKGDLVTAALQVLRQSYRDPLVIDQFSRDCNELLASLISQQTESYILDKARQLGLELEVQVETNVVDYYPVPWSVRLRGSPAQAQQNALTEFLETELGIPEERQEW